MNATNIAKTLKTKGLNPLRVENGSEDADGAIYLTEKVSVQVPTFGKTLGVVVEGADGKTFDFYPLRTVEQLDLLVNDAQEALGNAA